MMTETRRSTARKKSLSGRALVLVTGAAGAIGSATVDAFLERGFYVVGMDRDAKVTRAKGFDYNGIQVELEQEEAIIAAMRDVARIGNLAHIVGLAGGALPSETAEKGLLELDQASFAESIAANLVTQYAVVRAALPLLRVSEGDRSIALTSSFNALSGWGLPAYSAAKAGLIGLMHALTSPLGKEGIRINVVAPGTVRTPRTERLWGHEPGHFPGLESRSAIGRVGSPADVANAFVALATLLTHVTGQVLVVDGGQMVKRD
jgi:meso-butanediol dehydrogenase / (S,S)-butanediol dehydrogenase / diacetyl reductase